MRLFLIRTLTMLGEFKEHQRHQAEGLRDALRRGDTYAAVNLRVGFMNIAYLVADRPDLAEAHARAALGEWTAEGFNVVHYEGTASLINIELDRGEIEAAHERTMVHYRRTKRSLIWRVQLLRILVQNTVAGVSLAMLERGKGDRDTHLRRVARAASALERESLPWALPFVRVARAGVALHGGNRSDAAARLDTAARELDALSMKAYAAAARDRAARMRDDERRASDTEEAAEVLSAEGVVAPDRMMAMLLPGLRTEA